MSDTDKALPWWSSYYGREAPWAKRLTRRIERNRARQLMRNGRFDRADTRQVKPTQGWMTH